MCIVAAIIYTSNAPVPRQAYTAHRVDSMIGSRRRSSSGRSQGSGEGLFDEEQYEDDDGMLPPIPEGRAADQSYYRYKSIVEDPTYRYRLIG